MSWAKRGTCRVHPLDNSTAPWFGVLLGGSGFRTPLQLCFKIQALQKTTGFLQKSPSSRRFRSPDPSRWEIFDCGYSNSYFREAATAQVPTSHKPLPSVWHCLQSVVGIETLRIIGPYKKEDCWLGIAGFWYLKTNDGMKSYDCRGIEIGKNWAPDHGRSHVHWHESHANRSHRHRRCYLLSETWLCLLSRTTAHLLTGVRWHPTKHKVHDLSPEVCTSS